MAQPREFIIGYDPGGNGKHGLAVVRIEPRPEGVCRVVECVVLGTFSTVQHVIEQCESIIAPTDKLVACGVDTLTAWSRAKSGWRPADLRLRDEYKDVVASVDSSNHGNGSMCVNGALFLHWLAERGANVTEITEAHPKVCFFALKERKERHPWATKRDRAGQRKPPPPADQDQAKVWLLSELGLSTTLAGRFGPKDHAFDAMLACLAALRGFNKQWTTDLHQTTDPNVVQPFGRTRFWWPYAVP